jgi:signal transduction histidine kinase
LSKSVDSGTANNSIKVTGFLIVWLILQALLSLAGVYYGNMPEKASIWANHDALENIVFNILGNAFKYDTTSSKVSMNILLEGAHQAIEVMDDGPGIVNDKLDKIFDRYYRTEKSYQRAAGLGIGLSLAKELAILHDGLDHGQMNSQ